MGPLSFRRPAAWTPPGVQTAVVAIDGTIVPFTWTAQPASASWAGDPGWAAGSARTIPPFCTAEIPYLRAPDILARSARAPQSDPIVRGATLIRRMP